MQSTRISHKSQLKMIFVMLVNIQSWNWIKLIHSVMIIYCHDTCWYNSTTIFRVLYFLHKFNCFQWTTCCYVEQGSFKRFFFSLLLRSPWNEIHPEQWNVDGMTHFENKFYFFYFNWCRNWFNKTKLFSKYALNCWSNLFTDGAVSTKSFQFSFINSRNFRFKSMSTLQMGNLKLTNNVHVTHAQIWNSISNRRLLKC